MATDRYVVLGLAHPRSMWFREVGRWATAAALPLEFVKCVSAEEVRARLDGGRRFSALLADARVPGVDRDLLDVATSHGCPVLIIRDERVPRDWPSLGASAVLDGVFDRETLRLVLHEHAQQVSDVAATPFTPEVATEGWRAPLVAVLGAPGAGSTTAAMALAQGMADDPRHGGRVLLADLCLDADLALLHDARDIVPGVPELVDAHRLGDPTRADIDAVTFELPDHGYRLLLGVRRHRDWTLLRPRALRSALGGLRRAFRLIGADTDADHEGELECGSNDVEERNGLARTAVEQATLVVAVSTPTLKGVHDLVRLHDALRNLGVESRRIMPVLNRSGRGLRHRAEVTRTVASLLTDRGHVPVAAPLYLPERRRLDEVTRDSRRVPTALTTPLTRAVAAALEAAPPTGPAADVEGVPVAAGTLGHWTEADEP
jgi:hypothetical protein